MWRDWALVGAVTVTALLETGLRDDVVWRPFATALALGLVWPLLWRRTHPLAVVAVTFGAVIALNVATLLTSTDSVGLYTMIYILVLPYALLRWGSGREIAVGLAIIVVAYALGIAADYTNVGEAFAAAVFALSPAVLGAMVRFQATYQAAEKEQIKLLEREQLARELHDTVAHHVSAILVRAQAGRVVAATDPDAPMAALAVIEGEAARALTEMRLMVGALRDGETADLAPQQGVRDLPRLAAAAGDSPPVTVELLGDVDDLRPAVTAAIYRLAQESMTNALRHARHASRIDVRVNVESDSVQLTVVDDGVSHPSGRSPSGYGLVGMAERATLLGGTLEAGPGRDRGLDRECRAAAVRWRPMTIRVLVADDQEIVRTGLAMILGAQPDIEVVAQAADGRTAVDPGT